MSIISRSISQYINKYISSNIYFVGLHEGNLYWIILNTLFYLHATMSLSYLDINYKLMVEFVNSFN